MNGGIEAVAKTFNKVLGYDSIALKADWGNQNIYIAMIPEIIKIIIITKKIIVDKKRIF